MEGHDRIRLKTHQLFEHTRGQLRLAHRLRHTAIRQAQHHLLIQPQRKTVPTQFALSHHAQMLLRHDWRELRARLAARGGDRRHKRTFCHRPADQLGRSDFIIRVGKDQNDALGIQRFGDALRHLDIRLGKYRAAIPERGLHQNQADQAGHRKSDQ